MTWVKKVCKQIQSTVQSMSSVEVSSVYAWMPTQDTLNNIKDLLFHLFLVSTHIPTLLTRYAK